VERAIKIPPRESMNGQQTTWRSIRYLSIYHLY